MEVTALLCVFTCFHFAWTGTLSPNNSVQAYNSVDCQVQLTLMFRGRNSKTNKVAERKLVLVAEFLFTTSSFGLILTIQVFFV